MELMISGAFANKVLSLIKKDKGLAVSLAAEWLDRVDSSAIASYLLTPEIAVELLAGRLVSDPEQTMDDLQAIAKGGTVAAPVKTPKRRGPGRPRKSTTTEAAPKKTVTRKRGPRKAATTKAATPKKTRTRKVTTKKARARKVVAKDAGGIRRRKRLSSDQIAELKGKVLRFLGSVDSASRKEIITGAKIPTPAIYNRVVGELRDEKVVGTEGQKAKAVYFLVKKGKKSKKRGR